ncbi:P2X purinoceptor 7-like, partial [Saccoglossus kowalevskii]
MPIKSKDKILMQMVDNQPSLVFNLVEERSAQLEGYHPSSSTNNPEWCICRNCRQMPTQAERRCCGRLPESCISGLPDFQLLILNEAVLALASTYRRDILAVDDGDDLNRSNRHAAYRQFIMLGAGNRRIIPSCCIWGIRDKYTDEFGQYTGILPSR